MKRLLFVFPLLLFSCWYEQEMFCCKECTETVTLIVPDEPEQSFENHLENTCDIDDNEMIGIPKNYPDWKGKYMKGTIVRVKYECKGCVYDRTNYN